MLRIAVVDDEAEQRELIESFLARFACEQRREVSISCRYLTSATMRCFSTSKCPMQTAFRWRKRFEPLTSG